MDFGKLAKIVRFQRSNIPSREIYRGENIKKDKALWKACKIMVKPSFRKEIEKRIGWSKEFDKTIGSLIVEPLSFDHDLKDMDFYKEIKSFIKSELNNLLDRVEKETLNNSPAFLDPKIKKGYLLAIKIFDMTLEKLKKEI